MASQSIIDKQKYRRRVLDHLYETMNVGDEYADCSTTLVAKALGLTESRATQAVKDIGGIGIIERRISFRENIGGISGGRRAHWRLTIDYETAKSLLAELDREESERYDTAMRTSSGRRRIDIKPNQPVPPTEAYETPVIRHVNGFAVEAISGPDRPTMLEALRDLRKDESYALVEAARQYLGRERNLGSGIETLLAQASALGVKIDVESLRSAITIERDDRLESVSLVLPYIDLLERQVERLTTANVEYRSKLKAHDDLARENKSLRDQNTRLIAQRVAIAQQS